VQTRTVQFLENLILWRANEGRFHVPRRLVSKASFFQHTYLTIIGRRVWKRRRFQDGGTFADHA
jgi:hypothetical protein